MRCGAGLASFGLTSIEKCSLCDGRSERTTQRERDRVADLPGDLHLGADPQVIVGEALESCSLVMGDSSVLSRVEVCLLYTSRCV